MKVFESYLEFHNFLKENSSFGQKEEFSPFMNSVDGINKGCGCSKSGRVDRAVSEYLTISSKISPATIESIKIHYQVPTLQFKHNQGLFFEV